MPIETQRRMMMMEQQHYRASAWARSVVEKHPYLILDIDRENECAGVINPATKHAVLKWGAEDNERDFTLRLTNQGFNVANEVTEAEALIWLLEDPTIQPGTA